MFEQSDIDDLLEKRGVAVMVIGQVGAGKTASTRNLPPESTAFILSEKQGLRTLKNFGWKKGQFLIPEKVADYRTAVGICIQRPEIKTIVLDTLSHYYQLLCDEYNRKNGVAPESQDWRRLNYGLVLTESLLLDMFAGVERGLNVVVLVHSKHAVTSDTPLEPALPGQLPQRIGRLFDLIVHATTDHNGQKRTYKFDLPAKDSYAKDLFNLDWPRPNDVAQLIRDCGGDLEGAAPQTQHAKTKSPSFHQQQATKAAPSFLEDLQKFAADQGIGKRKLKTYFVAVSGDDNPEITPELCEKVKAKIAEENQIPF